MPGYARVSTNGQTLASQDAQLHAAGAAKVYAEKRSGARTDRPELAKLLKRLEAGDVLMVTRLDRLARSTRDLLNILDAVGKAGAAFKSLGDAWADTTTPHGRLMLTVLGGLAEFERDLILARTGAVHQVFPRVPPTRTRHFKMKFPPPKFSASDSGRRSGGPCQAPSFLWSPPALCPPKHN
jgi:DNA invertase Pin-like site-specific DNA recombinase